MNKDIDKIIAIITDKGDKLSQADMREIDTIALMIDPDVWVEHSAHIAEIIALTVNDPLYEGDIAPLD